MGDSVAELADLGARVVAGDRPAIELLDVALDRARGADDWEAVNAGIQPLAEAARDGSEESLAILLGLVDGHRLARPAIQRFLNDDHQVEEAAQTTLVSIAKGIDGFEGRSRFTSWLYTIASNEARQLIRREARRPAPVEIANVAADPALRRMSSVLVDRIRIEAAMDRLEEPYGTAVRLREIDGLSYDEIARRLDVEVGTVKSRIARGRERLAEDLGLG